MFNLSENLFYKNFETDPTICSTIDFLGIFFFLLSRIFLEDFCFNGYSHGEN